MSLGEDFGEVKHFRGAGRIIFPECRCMSEGGTLFFFRDGELGVGDGGEEGPGEE